MAASDEHSARLVRTTARVAFHFAGLEDQQSAAEVQEQSELEQVQEELFVSSPILWPNVHPLTVGYWYPTVSTEGAASWSIQPLQQQQAVVSLGEIVQIRSNFKDSADTPFLCAPAVFGHAYLSAEAASEWSHWRLLSASRSDQLSQRLRFGFPVLLYNAASRSFLVHRCGSQFLATTATRAEATVFTVVRHLPSAAQMLEQLVAHQHRLQADYRQQELRRLGELSRLSKAASQAEQAAEQHRRLFERSHQDLEEERRQREQLEIAITEERRRAVEAKEAEAELQLCIVCFEGNRTVCFSPCGHVSCCADCAEDLTLCPNCRTEIQQRTRVFI